MFKIDFEFETQYGKFSDALHLPDDHSLSDVDIEAMKQQRLTNWLAIIEAPYVPKVIEEPTDSEGIIDG